MSPVVHRSTGARDAAAAQWRGWLDSTEAARYAGFSNRQHPVRAFRTWVRRYGVPHERRGRVLVFDLRALDDAIRRRQAAARVPHGTSVGAETATPIGGGCEKRGTRGRL
jgi:hypothetical protein